MRFALRYEVFSYADTGVILPLYVSYKTKRKGEEKDYFAMRWFVKLAKFTCGLLPDFFFLL